MMKYIPIILIPFLFLGCFNRTGISAKYYANECSEYYDMQGFYHKDCKDDNVISYKEIGEQKDKIVDFVVGKEEEVKKPQGNVW